MFGTAMTAFKSSYAAVVRPETATAVVGLTKTVAAGEAVVAVNVSGAAKTIPQFVKKVGPGLATFTATHLALTGLSLEAIDLFENSREKRARRDELAALVQKIAREGQSDTLNEQVLVLTRADERRTFGQWVRDLPSRTFRRVTRLCLVEAGWWYMVITAPIAATAFVADLIYTLGLLPMYTVFANAFGHQVDGGERLPQKFFMWLINHTFWAGFRVFKTGAQMRLYNRSATKANIASYPVLEAASAVATTTIVSIVDGHTAFAWGEAFAESISAQGLSTEQIQQAYAQAPYWISETVGENMCNAVLAGVRTGTPVIYRDLVSVTA